MTEIVKSKLKGLFSFILAIIFLFLLNPILISFKINNIEGTDLFILLGFLAVFWLGVSLAYKLLKWFTVKTDKANKIFMAICSLVISVFIFYIFNGLIGVVGKRINFDTRKYGYFDERIYSRIGLIFEIFILYKLSSVLIDEVSKVYLKFRNRY